jgi:predicted MFS family arabinose efflux permease
MPAEPALTSPASPEPARAAPARWAQLARLALGTASALGLARFGYGLILPAMRTELRWSLAQAGALTTANALGYLLGAVATVPAARRLSVTATFRLGMVLTAAALAITAATSSYPLLLLTRAAAGLAGALVFITGGVIASHAAASVRSATPLTVYYSGAGLGIALGGTAIPPLLSHHPGRWPLAWVALAAAASLAAVLSWSAARGTHHGSAAPVDIRRVVRQWQPAAAYLLFAAGYIAYITFLSAYLAAHRASLPQITLTWALLGLAAVAAPALWSRPISTWPRAAALAAALAVLSAAAAAPLASVEPLALIASAIGYGGSFLVVPAAVTALIRAATPPSEWTGALTAFTLIFAVGQTGGPYLAGVLADRYGTGATLAWTTALCAIAAALSTSSLSRGGSVASLPRRALGFGQAITPRAERGTSWRRWLALCQPGLTAARGRRGRR